jgi:FPC/CPF motif-containing protein YcgG
MPFETNSVHFNPPSDFYMQLNLINSIRADGGDTDGRDKCPWNPLSVDPVASQYSSYAAFQDTKIVRPLIPEVSVDAELIDAHDQLIQQIAGDYPCTGAISVFAKKCYRFGLFPALACDNAVRAVCHDLYEFCHEFPIIDDHLNTFIAMFRGPTIESEQHFEDLLWSQLQAMHEIDSSFFAWDKSVDSDPKNNNFSFSIGGRAMFVIGMHPKASRLARTFRYPTMVFNLHAQFERLRARGKFETMKQIIRAREISFQGSINPMLKNFGESSEASQYSGRPVSENWPCPFHARKQDET